MGIIRDWAHIEPHLREPVFASLEHLTVRQLCNVESARMLASALDMEQLRTLELARPEVDVEIVDALLDGLRGATLRTLHIEGYQDTMPLDAFASLMSHEALGSLDALKVSSVDPEGQALDVIMDASCTDTIAVLELAEISCSESGLGRLASDAPLPELLALDLFGNDLGRRGALALADMGGSRAWQRLALENCGVDGPGLAALLAAPHTQRIEVLEIAGNPYGEEGILARLRHPAPRHTDMLNLEGFGVTDTFIATLVDRWPSSVRTMVLPSGISAESYLALARVDALFRVHFSPEHQTSHEPIVEFLDKLDRAPTWSIIAMDDCGRLSDDIAFALARCEHLTDVRIWLSRWTFSRAGVEAFVASPRLDESSRRDAEAYL